MSASRDRHRPPPAILLALLAAGCVSYEPAPLDPEAILAREIARRSVAPSAAGMTLAESVQAMRGGNTRVREAWAAYRTAAEVARTPTPLPNPSLTAGPLFLQGADLLGSAAYGAEAALGWTVLLSGTRAIRDEVNGARAQAALLEAAGVEREEYLRLRADVAAVALLTSRYAVRTEVAAASATAVDASRRLIEAGQATALDLRLLELEAARSEAAVVAEEANLLEARVKLAARTGRELAAVGSLPPDALAPLPPAVPPVAELQRTMLRDHPALNTLRARYVVAEEEFRLEVARQYPSLGLGPSYERAEKVDRFGLPFGIDLPLFDRNQQGVARARAARDELRVQFEAAVAERLGLIETGSARLGLAQRRLAFARSRLEPVSRETIDLARRGLQAGAVDALRMLEALRTGREVRLDLATAEFEMYNAWLGLEQACGVPLLRFPAEPVLDASPTAPVKEDSR